MHTNTKESGFEAIILNHLTTHNHYEQGTNADYNKDHAIDTTRLFRFLQTTQPDKMAQLAVDTDTHKRNKFLAELQKQITNRGIVDVLRKGFKYYPVDLITFYATPSDKNATAKTLFEQNIFSVTQQLQYSKVSANLALDLAIFINGLPVMTLELKNQLTGQNTDDAVHQYQNDRDPKDLLFQFKRCMVHFAVDDVRIKFCTKLEGKNSWFLPFDKGYNDGAGNPPNPNGIKTDYLWKEILTKQELANIIENYAQVTEEKDETTGKIKYKQIFPRYHQLHAVKQLLADVKMKGVGQRYLIQHSAGSGKSNSIAWLAHQLVGLERDGENIIGSVIVVTDRVNLDKQIKNTIKQFMQMGNTVAWAESASDLRTAISTGKKIIITTVHKFPFILDDIGTAHKNSTFAIIIDEAHSSQSGSMAASMNMALGADYDSATDIDTEDKINQLVEGRKLLTNASYFAFTATPKGKTIELFGEPMIDQLGNPVVNEQGEPKRQPFHNYSMKQAIQEGFILDVLKHYTPIQSYYKLIKTLDDDPNFDKKKAQKKLRKFVESDAHTIAIKAEMMVTHFHEQVIAKGKIGGQARAMVVTSGIDRAIDYFYAIKNQLEARNSPYKPIIAFSGEKEYNGKNVTESSINQFPSGQIEKNLKTDPYRLLIVADKFQTGYDEPLLHTMYVDKQLSDIKAVQTLSRLNRSHPQKLDTMVLDFYNDPEDIQKSFERYYRTTLLSGETDPNKLYELITIMESHEVYTDYHIDTLVELFLNTAERHQLDPILDTCANLYTQLDEDEQVAFKSSAKAFVRTYGFLGAILPYGNSDWEKLNIFLTLLVPKLPSPKDEDLSQGILDAIDLDSYRAEKQGELAILLADSNAEVDPVPTSMAGGVSNPELDSLSNILMTFNDMFGDIPWQDADNVRHQISRIPSMVSQDERYQNAMRNADKQEARTVSDRVLREVVLSIMTDNIELFKQYSDNPDFKRWLADMVFTSTYNSKGAALSNS